MISSLHRMWAAAPIATVILVIALSASAVFGVRTIGNWVYWNDPAHIDQPIAGWMTPRYVAFSWDVPRPVMIDAIAMGDKNPEGRNLKRLAEAQGISLEELILRIETAIEEHRTTATKDGGQP
ncbi:hypothetical protein MWU53_05205 [Aliiroseovarius sp. S1123]|uniref:hypothetical protein n=1 Tax=unclassified Aliiroseovarius TaxID=2623558 RepID=UPI001FF65BC8|nr:hypothetical protein [Aliiroseovarius sp. S1123]MCK0170451.1 hypothetical protein [Aliiroseovarius sp. S1123]